MSGFLLDTNCVSELVSVKPGDGVIAWIEAVDETLLFLSVVTLGEIRRGLAALPQSRRRTHLETWIDLELHARFAGRILPIDAQVADRWGLLTAGAKRAGKTLATIDGLLAATAIHHNLTIVSRNVSDFASAPVQLLNPWKA